MSMLEKLHRKALKQGARFQIRFDTTMDEDQQWIVKFYPEPDENAHFWAEGKELEGVLRQIIEEMEEAT